MRSWNCPWMSPHICRNCAISWAHETACVVAYRHWRIDAHHIALLNEQLACLVTQLSNLILGNGTACAELLNGSVMAVSAALGVYVVEAEWLAILVKVATARAHGDGSALRARTGALWRSGAWIRGNAPKQRVFGQAVYVAEVGGRGWRRGWRYAWGALLAWIQQVSGCW